MENLARDLFRNAMGVWIGLITIAAAYFILRRTPFANVANVAQKLSTPGSN